MLSCRSSAIVSGLNKVRPVISMSSKQSDKLLGVYVTPMRPNRMSAMPFVNHTIVEVNQFRDLAVQMITARVRKA